MYIIYVDKNQKYIASIQDDYSNFYVGTDVYNLTTNEPVLWTNRTILKSYDIVSDDTEEIIKEYGELLL